MSNENCQLKPVRCGCGGEAKAWSFFNNRWYVKCRKCSVGQMFAYPSEAEAITAWNRAMGSTEKSSTVERTAKVKDLERRSETSMSWEGICSNCGSYTMHEMDYCFHCGCRLEWE